VNRRDCCKRTLLVLLILGLVLAGCANPSGNDDDDPVTPPTPGVWSVTLDSEELGAQTLQVYSDGNLSAVALLDLSPFSAWDQQIVGLDSLGELDWYRTLENDWNHVLFPNDGGWLAFGIEERGVENATEILITTMESNGSGKSTRYVDLPDSLQNVVSLSDVSQDSSGGFFITGTRWTYDTEEINDADAILLHLNSSDEFDWAYELTSLHDDPNGWLFGDLAMTEANGNALLVGRATPFSEYQDRLLVVSVSSSGEFADSVTYQGSESLRPKGATLSAIDRVIVTAEWSGGTGSTVVAFDETLNRTWFGNFTDLVGYSLLELPSGNYVLVGEESDHSEWFHEFQLDRGEASGAASTGEYNAFLQSIAESDGALILGGMYENTSPNDTLGKCAWITRTDEYHTLVQPTTTVFVQH